MFVLDTDTLSLFLRAHARVTVRFAQAKREVAITSITRIELLQGRFASVLKAENGEKLLRAQSWLVENENDLNRFTILAIDSATAAEFDRLRQNKKLKKIGRCDLLIAAITLANRATLVTRNRKDFGQVPGLKVEDWAD
jgi:tRNA(fMet)-specific endonuclease VapC